MMLALLVQWMPLGIHSAEERGISASEVKQALRSEDRGAAVRALNLAKRSQESDDLQKLMIGLWNNDRRGVADVPWDRVNEPRIKIQIANFLAQASNNGYVTVDRKTLRSYARNVASGADMSPRTTAILTLGLLGDPDDIDLLREIALEENPQTFRSAIISLARMCDSRSAVAISEIGSKAMQSANRDFARAPASELAPFKKCP